MQATVFTDVTIYVLERSGMLATLSRVNNDTVTQYKIECNMNFTIAHVTIVSVKL